MNNNIEKNICNAIEIIVNKKISELDFNKTITARVIEDLGDGDYKIQFQDTKLTASALGFAKYENGDTVNVLILNNDINKSRFILSKTMYTAPSLEFNYNDLENKPKINNVELSGNKSLRDLGIVIPDPYTLPIASKKNLGGIKIGDNLTITEDGTLSANKGITNYNELENKPSLNGIELEGNKTLQQLGIQGTLPFRFGIDENGNYGYYKVGADTLTPFNESKEPVPYGGVRARGLVGNYGRVVQIII